MKLQLLLAPLCFLGAIAAPALESPSFVCPKTNGCIDHNTGNTAVCGCCHSHLNGLNLKCLIGREPEGCPWAKLEDGREVGDPGYSLRNWYIHQCALLSSNEKRPRICRATSFSIYTQPSVGIDSASIIPELPVI
ncbi:hypothetical protein N431DRAFT_457395 [Stipitochalara longipes BDJ]|nr:hypothetical protein N431DRAFT_457395 [Stipitochalara longipes BDJ]